MFHGDAAGFDDVDDVDDVDDYDDRKTQSGCT